MYVVNANKIHIYKDVPGLLLIAEYRKITHHSSGGLGLQVEKFVRGYTIGGGTIFAYCTVRFWQEFVDPGKMLLGGTEHLFKQMLWLWD